MRVLRNARRPLQKLARLSATRWLVANGRRPALICAEKSAQEENRRDVDVRHLIAQLSPRAEVNVRANLIKSANCHWKSRAVNERNFRFFSRARARSLRPVRYFAIAILPRAAMRLFPIQNPHMNCGTFE